MLPAPSWLRFGKSRGQQQQETSSNKRNQRQSAVETSPSASSPSPPSPPPPQLPASQSAPQRECTQPAASPATLGTGGASSGAHRAHNLPTLRRSLTNFLQRLMSPSSSSSQQQPTAVRQSAASRASRRKRRQQDQATNEPSSGVHLQECTSDASGSTGVGGRPFGAEPSAQRRPKEQQKEKVAVANAMEEPVGVTSSASTSTSAQVQSSELFKLHSSPMPFSASKRQTDSTKRAVIDRCHLTARTSDNQCALHGEPTVQTSTISAAQQQQQPTQTRHHEPSEKASAELVVTDQPAISDQKMQQQQQQPSSVLPSFPSNTKAAQPISSSLTNNSNNTQQTTARKGLSRKRTTRNSTPQATWPLVKQTLNWGSSYGDAEDVTSPHLLANRLNICEQSKWTRRALDQVSSLSQQSNANHKRPFCQPFERPSAGWIYNAISANKINIGQSLKAKLFAASGCRRGSYDDQEGDNDINIILQPSDLHDIEKRARLNTAAFGTKSLATSSSRIRTKSSTDNSNNNFYYYNNNNNNDLSDLKLAKCLLDQDYNLTVRLFIGKSALNWNFNSFTFDALCCGRSLTELLLHLFDYYDLYNIFNLDIVKVLKCFRLLEFGYHSTNPYHNSIHAADVTQAMHCFIQEKKIRKHMTHLETLCSILAAVCHDLDHPGVSQSFLVATNNPLASLYNNNSVLENHHWKFALCIFKESQLFDHFTEDVFSQMKIQLKHLILATDIARQNEYLKRFRDLTSSHDFSMQNPDDRSLVLQMALKCADLGNPCRSWLISRVWSNLICDEFYKMGQIERQLGIPLTPICQREKTSIAGIQTDFFRFIVLPLLELWHKFLESPLSSLLMSNFEHNYQRWQRANRIVQQLKRRKSVACIEPVEDSEDTTNSSDISGFCAKQPFAAIKKASSDYIKSGNGSLESLRNFQLERIIEKSPLITRSRLAQEIKEKQQHKQDSRGEPKLAKENTKSSARTNPLNQKHNVHRRSEQKVTEQHSSRCAQPVASHVRNMPACSGYRKALSPIEDGEASSPDMQQQQQQGPHLRVIKSMNDPALSLERLSSSSSDSSLLSRASSACSSPVIRRSMSSRTSMDQSMCASAHHQHIKPLQQHQQQRTHPSLPHYYDASGQSIGLFSNKRRESDPGCCTNKYELAAALVLIQFQNNPLYHRRRSSLPVCVPKRRSSS